MHEHKLRNRIMSSCWDGWGKSSEHPREGRKTGPGHLTKWLNTPCYWRADVPTVGCTDVPMAFGERMLIGGGDDLKQQRRAFSPKPA
jgi:hypothetical protein